MKKKETDKGLKFVELTLSDRRKLGYGNICDTCNEVITGVGYFPPVYCHRIFCEKCFEDIKKHKVYEEDKPYEERMLSQLIREMDEAGVVETD